MTQGLDNKKSIFVHLIKPVMLDAVYKLLSMIRVVLECIMREFNDFKYFDVANYEGTNAFKVLEVARRLQVYNNVMQCSILHTKYTSTPFSKLILRVH